MAASCIIWGCKNLVTDDFFAEEIIRNQIFDRRYTICGVPRGCVL
jgi:hypothetical protein